MLALALAASLAAAPAPRIAASANTVVHVPQFDRVQGLTAFLERAGTYSSLLRPAAWRPELHPFLELDPAHPETLAALGIDAAGPATVSMRGDGRVSCTHLKDAKTFQAKAAEALAPNGAVKPVAAKGVTTVSLPRPQGGSVGYALKGDEACAFGGSDERGALLKEAVRLVGRAPTPDARMGKVPGVLYLQTPEGVLGLDGTANSLQVEGTASTLPLPPFQALAASPYGAVKPEGLLVARAQIAPAGVAQALGSVRTAVQSVCPECPADGVKAVAAAVARQLTGAVLLDVDAVQVRGSLRSATGRFFAGRQALAAEVKDAAAAKAALEPVGQFPGAKPLADGWALAVKGGTLVLRLKGNQLVMGNDEAVTQALLGVLPAAPTAQQHAVEFAVDPKRLARGLSQVSLLDVMGDDSLAAMFAASSELGPLLARSERLTGWLDSAAGGGHRFAMTWALPPAQ
ncbi:hypothetical protein KRR26_26120 [Corallococcus sp. M34]|uniref:hypothetical protein n=1 Tax=Citreicoccus inhibens TaxID=2849499 RepID=UPI001C23DE79|nr:hypothetical protein [Citreicoccus inhibens]MBU8899094.1 hypothetical protein [Citreicoccus inhibens]